MIIKTKVQKWGNGLAIRIAGLMRDIPHFEDGTPIKVEITESGLIIKKIHKSKNKVIFPYSEQELLSALTPENAYAELIAKPLPNEF